LQDYNIAVTLQNVVILQKNIAVILQQFFCAVWIYKSITFIII